MLNVRVVMLAVWVTGGKLPHCLAIRARFDGVFDWLLKDEGDLKLTNSDYEALDRLLPKMEIR